MNQPLFSCSGITKQFGASKALSDINIDLYSGEVHAIIGENGAGKSTLMKILSGAVAPDTGKMLLENNVYAPKSPGEARNSGVIMIYQELSLAPHLSVTENINLGIEPVNRFGLIDKPAVDKKSAEILGKLGHSEIDLNKKTGELSQSEKQIIEIARALVMEPRIIIFDEPTSSLNINDIHHLFELINKLKSQGIGIYYISHFLEDIKQVADRASVLRDGKLAATCRAGEKTVDELVELMVGKKVQEYFPKKPHTQGEALLEIISLSGNKTPRDVSINLHRGEILGITGLVGAGKTELLKSIFGLQKVKSGEIRVFGNFFGWEEPHRRIKQGMGFLSEDRKTEGIALKMGIEDNIFLSNPGRCSEYGFINRKKRHEQVNELVKKFEIKCASTSDPVYSLSGGNQQKAAFSRLVYQEADIFLLDEPTRGIDVNSKTLVYGMIQELACSGKAVIVVSSYFQELLNVCDTLHVMYRGTISNAVSVEKLNEEKILNYAAAGSFN